MSIAGKGQSSKFRLARDEHALVVMAQDRNANPSECWKRVLPSCGGREPRRGKRQFANCVRRRTPTRLINLTHALGNPDAGAQSKRFLLISQQAFGDRDLRAQRLGR